MERRMLPFYCLLWTVITEPLVETEKMWSQNHHHQSSKRYVQQDYFSVRSDSMSICDSFHNNECGCKQQACEYDTLKNACMDGELECEKIFNGTDINTLPICFRAGVWYSSGGALCQTKISNEASGKCKIEEVILAVNLGGDEIVGHRGIPYQADRDVPRFIQAEIRNYEKNTSATRKVENAEQEDLELFHTVVMGAGKKRCDTYKIPLEKEGRYELNLKLKEGCWKEAASRYFTVKFAGLKVFSEIDIFTYAGGADIAVDLAVNFEVAISEIWEDELNLTVTGFEKDIPLTEPYTVLLEFCASKCQVPDPHFLLAAFSVVRYEAVDGGTTTTTTTSPTTTSELPTLPPTPPPTTTPPPAPPPPPITGTGPPPKCNPENVGLRWTWPGTSSNYQECVCSYHVSPAECYWEFIIACKFGKIFNFDAQECVNPRPPSPPPTSPPPPPGPGSGSRPPCTIVNHREMVQWPDPKSIYEYHECDCEYKSGQYICSWHTRWCRYPKAFSYVDQYCLEEPSPPAPDRPQCVEASDGQKLPWANEELNFFYEECDCFFWDNGGSYACNWVGYQCKRIREEIYDHGQQKCVRQ